ncbi:MAG TPA: L,D-transpeptidase family protein [Pyrinomonadaceae bacterium]|nr:L,D-transpeptidase family protein [Pyrinomonadaceae bacterium]
MKLGFCLCLILIFASTRAVKAQAPQQPPLNRLQIKEAERLLTERGYWTGVVDGRFDPGTQSALIAFQKWEGRAVTGKLTLEEIETIRTSSSPGARETGYAHVEVDLDRQVLLIVDERGGVKVLPVSTGSNKPFMDHGKESIAYTPRGRFLVYDKTFGWENGDLGSVYYANYITGGVAIHGFRSVPTEPASHGCIRIPMFAAREVSKLLTLGTIVLVFDKVSFVSGKSWAENPQLKEAALESGAARDYLYEREKPR